MILATPFLREPDLFPARLAGEPWGQHSIGLDIVGGPYRLEGLSRAQLEAVRRRFADHLVAAAPDPLGNESLAACAPIAISIFRIEESEFLDLSPDALEYVVASEPTPGRVALASPDFIGLLDLEQSGDASVACSPAAAALWTARDATLVDTGAIENFLRVVVAYRLLALGGVMLHSAAIARNQQASVFVGHSGAGKSTLSRLSHDAGLGVISDDLNALVPGRDGGDWWVDQLPFAGDFRGQPVVAGRFPLAGIYHLEQAPEHGLRVLSTVRSVALLVANAPFVNSDPHRQDLLIEVLCGLASQASAHTLSFRRDADFWQLLPETRARVRPR